jgi:hypothetical protein
VPSTTTNIGIITGSIPVGDAHAAEHGNIGIDS